MDESQQFLIKLIVSGLINLGILAYMTFAIFDYRKLFWSKVEGLITKSQVHSYLDSENDTMYEPKVEYEYIFNGQHYHSDKIGFAIHASSSPKASEELLSNFALNWKVTVFVNPDNPSDSTLKPGLGVYQLGFLGFLIFGFYFWVPVGWIFWGAVAGL